MDTKDDFKLEMCPPENAHTTQQSPTSADSLPEHKVEEPAQEKSAQGADEAKKKSHAKKAPEAESVPDSTHSLLTVTLLQELVSLLRPKPFRKRHPILFWGGILLCLSLVWQLFSDEETSFGSDRIAVVRIEGAIMETEPTLEWIRELEKKDSVKGILLRIDSPGGGAAASQEIHGALLTLGKKKPIVASMGSSAASGGLMVAMAAPYIVANPSTITGSIGVRMDLPQIYKLMESIGVGQESLTSGKFKDAGSMMRALSPEDREYFQGIIDDLYGQFVAMVAEGRKKPVEEIEKIADGRVFTGREALHLGIVDALGGQDVALAELYQRTGVNPKTELYEDKDFEKMYGSMLKSMMQAVMQSVTQVQGHEPTFMFR